MDLCLPVTAVGSAPGSFLLSNVLVALRMVHNLLSIRQFTTDNSCSIEFYSSGLTVKDSASRRPLLRCDSTGPLYTLRLPSSAAPLSSSSSPWPSWSAAFAATPSSTTWHRRLGHPGREPATFWLSSVVVPMFLVLGLLLSPSVMRASSVVMFSFLFFLLRM